MATYSYSKTQLDKRNRPAKSFWSFPKIAAAIGFSGVVFIGTCIALTPNQPAPVAVAPAAPVVVGNYDAKTDECRLKDGSGVLINFTKGNLSDFHCDELSTYNLQEYAEQQKRFPGADKALVAPDRYDMAIMGAAISKDSEREAAESQSRLEEWAVRSYEADQKHQEKCQDLIESRGYGEVGCY